MFLTVTEVENIVAPHTAKKHIASVLDPRIEVRRISEKTAAIAARFSTHTLSAVNIAKEAANSSTIVSVRNSQRRANRERQNG
jgi:hypothetical protein